VIWYKAHKRINRKKQGCIMEDLIKLYDLIVTQKSVVVEVEDDHFSLRQIELDDASNELELRYGGRGKTPRFSLRFDRNCGRVPSVVKNARRLQLIDSDGEDIILHLSGSK
jgi:hypothetical protein